MYNKYFPCLEDFDKSFKTGFINFIKEKDGLILTKEEIMRVAKNQDKFDELTKNREYGIFCDISNSLEDTFLDYPYALVEGLIDFDYVITEENTVCFNVPREEINRASRNRALLREEGFYEL